MTCVIAACLLAAVLAATGGAVVGFAAALYVKAPKTNGGLNDG